MNVQQPRGTKREGVLYLTLSADAAEFAIQRMRIMGWQGTDLRDLRGIDRNYFDVDVSYETFDGKERLRLEVLTPAKAQHKAELQDAELGALALQYSDHAARAPEVHAPTPKNAKPGGAAPTSEDFGGFDHEDAS